MRTLLLLLPLLPCLPAFAGETVLENDYVRVTRDAAPCAAGGGAGCGARVIVALDGLVLACGPARRELARGDTAVLAPDEACDAPEGAYFEVAIKPGHPAATAPPVHIPPEKNAIRHEEADFFVFEEKLAPGDTRARHSHSQRVVIQLNRARLKQWPDGAPEKIVETVPDRAAFSPPVVHVVENIGDVPLRGVIIEFKP